MSVIRFYLNMHLYQHRVFKSEVIEFTGLSNHDLVFRYLGDDFKNVFFSLTKAELKKHWQKLPKRS